MLIFCGSSGIGYGVADKALAEGARVHIASSNASRLQQSVNNLQEKYPEASITGQECDLKKSQVEMNLGKLLKSFKPLDHIVYTAGDALLIRSIDQIDLDIIHQAGHVRLFVQLLLAKHVQQSLRPGYQSSLTLTTGVGG